MRVSSFIETIPPGVVLMITNGRELPNNAMPGIITLSPFVRGLFSNPFLIRFPMPLPNCICCPFEIKGARIASLASFTSALLIFTRSPKPLPAFFLVKLSILIVSFPSSVGCALQTTAAVIFVPSISITSPIDRSKVTLV